MPLRKKHFGVGAMVSCVTKFLHPSALIRQQFINNSNELQNHRTAGMILLREEEKTVSRRQQMCYVVTHVDYRNDDGSLKELYTVKRHFRCDIEGDPTGFFEQLTAEELLVEQQVAPQNNLPPEVQHFNLGEDDLRLPTTD